MAEEKRIFNDYDDKGFRRTITGSKSHYTTDNNIVSNLRFRWPKELEAYSDVKLINEYDEFASSDQFGNNDENFLEFLKLGE